MNVILRAMNLMLFPYFKELIVYTASKYEPLMDIFSDKYQYLSKEKQKVYS